MTNRMRFYCVILILSVIAILLCDHHKVSLWLCGWTYLAVTFWIIGFVDYFRNRSKMFDKGAVYNLYLPCWLAALIWPIVIIIALIL